MSQRNNSQIKLTETEFKTIGYGLVESLATFLEQMPKGKVTSGKTPNEVRALLDGGSFSNESKNSKKVVDDVFNLLSQESLFNGHPKFLGYITSSPAPLGVLSDLLASAMNPNVGAQILSPVATEIEKQTVRWLCEFIGVPTSFGGVLVSGGNMANFTAFLAARNFAAGGNYKKKGISGLAKPLVFYCSKSTHTWIDKAAVLFGHGTESVHWIEADEDNRIRLDLLAEAIEKDKRAGKQPAIAIGTAGDVSTGAIDDLEGLSNICKAHKLWFHVDGAYGAPAAILPELINEFSGLKKADSIAIDPHKWLYAPLEAGCTLVKNPNHLIDTFSSHPEYYNFSHNDDGKETNFFEYGLQNSRGFRALKVWIVLQQVGKEGYKELIRDDIDLAKYLYELAQAHPELEAMSHHLSITTCRYIPVDFDRNNPDGEKVLNALNETLLNALEKEGEVFLSNAVIHGKYCLRACVVNFRTSRKDIEEIIEIVVKRGVEIYKNM